MSNIPPFDWLGQSGVRVPVTGGAIYIDPYLSDSVAELEGSTFTRCRPPPFDAGEVTDAVAVLISHEHLDHCDPATLGPVSEASESAIFLVASAAAATVRALGLDPERIIVAEERWIRVGDGVEVHAVMAAHPIAERDAAGRPRRVGFVLKTDDVTYYHAGDTSVCREVIDGVRRTGASPDIAFLPVNEKNFYREAMGIIGNMSVREAAIYADDVGVPCWVPIHWDMFSMNSLSVEEIRATVAHVAGKSSLILPDTE